MKLKTVVAAMLMALAAVVIASGCKPNITPGQDSTAPAEVTNLQAVAGDGKISLSWTNPGDADLYQVEITASPAAGSLASPVYLSAEKGKTMSYSATGLTNGTAYTFTVKTVDKSRNKSKGVTTEKAITPTGTGDKTPPQGGGGGTGGSAADTTAPAEVTNLKAVPTGNSKISVSWTNPADADLHQVEITVQKEGETAVSTVYISAEKGKDSGYIIESLVANATYTVTVKTIDKALNKSKDGVSKTVTTNAASSVMSLTLTQNPEKETKTNGDVTVTVESSTSINEAKWKKGAHDAKTVLESGTAITDKRFTVSENGIYSIAVLDNDGRREAETINIENIDKDPPPAPTNLTAEYRFGEKKIILKWSDPVDTASGLKELKLSYTVNGANEKTETIAKGVQTFEIENVEPQSSPESYAFSLKAVDNAGNEGAAASRTITPSSQADVTGISLNRTHLDTKMTDRDIEVTITGSNFDKLTSLLVQVTDSSTNYPAVTAVIDKPNNTARAIVQAPKPTSPTDEGTTYTVKAIVNSATPAAATASFIVSNPATVRNIELKPTQLKLGSATKISVAVTGTNFDIRGETKIKLLDSKGDEAVGSTVTVAENVGNETEFTVEIANLPSVSGVYTVAVFFKGNKQTKTAQLQLYGAPEIASVTIPKAGKSYGGNKLPVTITGKNFTAPGASFSGSGASITNFTVVNDTTATAEVTCPYSAGEHPVTVTCGTESNTGTLSVKDYTGYDVGKIVLADKTLVDKGGYTINSTNPPVGIICGSNSYKVPRMIALHTSGSDLEWAKDGSTGYNTTFEGIICTPSPAGNEAAETATFTGDTDGSDNWAYICSIDPDGTANAAVNYPAFNWVNTYNKTYETQLNNKIFAWYMPSLAELCEVYKNRDAINKSLEEIHKKTGGSTYADQSLGTSYYRSYWSSSQKSTDYRFAWPVNFYNGYVDYNSFKDNDKRVCCLAGF